MIAATILAAFPAGAVAPVADDPDAFPPIVLSVEDLTGDGTVDVALGQPTIADPLTWLVRVVDGRTGATVWQEPVRKYVALEPVVLGASAGGFAIAQNVTGGPTDTDGLSLRVRVVGADGEARWDRTFDAQALVPNPLPSYVRPAFRGVAARPGEPDGVLVQTDTRIEAGAERLTRTTATFLDAATGEAFAEHGPIETSEQDVTLVPLPDVSGDGVGDFGALAAPVQPGQVGPSTLRAYSTADGALRWTADVRAASNTGVVPLTAGGVRLLSLTADAFDAGGVQLLAEDSGEKVVDRPRGGATRIADATGGASRIRSTFFSEDGEPNGWTVELLDVEGTVRRRVFFPVGRETTFTVQTRGLTEAGDVDGDGWLDLLAHNAFTTPGKGTAYDDRIVDGRTLGSMPVPRDVESLVWSGTGTAAVDGSGDDLYVLAGRSARVLDGRTLRPLLALSAPDRIGLVLGARGAESRCADVVVVTYVPDDFALTRLGPRGEARWQAGARRATARDLSGSAGCSERAVGPGGGGGTTIPATGGLPLAALAAGAASAAVLLRRRARAA